jgi:hypothetical protein
VLGCNACEVWRWPEFRRNISSLLSRLKSGPRKKQTEAGKLSLVYLTQNMGAVCSPEASGSLQPT